MFETSLYYAASCTVVHLVIWIVFSKLRLVDRKKMHHVVNRVVSSVHAMIMFSLAASYWATLTTSFWIMEETVAIEAGVTTYQRMTMECMVGYLVYDTIVELRIGKSWMMLGHHIIGFISHTLALIDDNGSTATYSMMVYLAEISTPFLHLSWMLKEFGYKQSLVFLLCGMLLMLTFFVFRVLLSPYMLAHMCKHWRADDTSYHFPLNLVIVSSFMLINYYWFYMLASMLPLPGRRDSPKDKTKKID